MEHTNNHFAYTHLQRINEYPKIKKPLHKSTEVDDLFI
jgi:hypothetical protein